MDWGLNFYNLTLILSLTHIILHTYSKISNFIKYSIHLTDYTKSHFMILVHTDIISKPTKQILLNRSRNRLML